VLNPKTNWADIPSTRTNTRVQNHIKDKANDRQNQTSNEGEELQVL
jgi:hypothetical protein